ncbi:5-formyltetrahydrofolate cyclo-ligase [Frankia sp. AgB1.9]|uniref:5-formyltetrahydrofolate cyclo-ligase n=1 Tax=unclassified Frankia TaxID=2632575 RepID=UPI0019345567|nr:MULTISPECIES: 5-formyltetrahydrofolate cyclo-ligase [unclassified Frankia]MBL7492032.1 5-formyltetrahydrofolate cyclo-ligase [Frankia sp. AgW1.1]MBL7552424.1 5-formyltetrahydrofolate cyclo-ligase [Frankia sp. AgB1.9]MBL7622693.1 5-formyltetrahydrofolate cyclo-ligase [Frankia sp. AgB1.8]
MGEQDADDAIARAKSDLRSALAACRKGIGPRPGPGAGLGQPGSWPATGRGPAGPSPSIQPGPQTRAQEAVDGAQIARRVLSLPEVTSAGRIAAFVSLPGEPSTLPLLDALRAHGLRVLLPVVRGDLDLDFREYTGTLVPGALGTREPPPAAATVDLASADVVLVPAVAVDPRGHRLGRGGGSYDRALRRVRAGATLVAVVDEHAIVEAVPVAEHDLSVSVIVTPTRLLRCR